MKSAITILLCTIVGMFCLITVSSSGVRAAMADDVASQLKATAQTGAGYDKPTDIRVTVALIVRVVLGSIGFVFFCLIIYSGVLWMTASGNEEQLGKAKKLIYNSVIGLIITLSAYSITWFAAKIAFNRFQDNSGGVKPIYSQDTNTYFNYPK